jgi:hypothetical protein
MASVPLVRAEAILMSPTRPNARRGLAATVSAAFLVAGIIPFAPAAGAAPLASCEATQAAPTCTFVCPPLGSVRITVVGTGMEPYIQGTIACGGNDGQTGYIAAMTIQCYPEGASSFPYSVLDSLYGAVLGSGCTDSMTNPGTGTDGQCRLDQGVSVVCEAV